ncbi:UDP-2,4-diacetamido-2,4,6-trideoxy-beta-L-altropyranose hydrolase [Stutzerimonas sp. Brlt_13]|uniref:UDP-2,4-diacetamido-2,4, 6-trideoxy-beta-L-altropyranose hydrolase n=1 Tax=Stutzerimonas TaxID=2901164 RepID=UPI00210E9795|nr:UDP-2,4-diacetamido-2,4,6-trideoxy-beta-L-altropyranose hydrolase [Stutzerimonas stutzeri]MCQ4236728.1 UDP-2,4-diacetamido-2,4,6-trideoxy-beta-L-altropyranose hydrolase [Stutzerimonas stutzeri]MDH0182281.1 UDP-2,4-diacetamido-2,4,6-trideoxy-beta-L-altropyranose hydrolase [Stutzerimonas stutzeri]MDH1246897.1 UDP-2,4-diacetamido-2,4,6-trideoxy-beta-L-altropyranose hydrolase [Stutzerimonas stutzeri]MDH1542761.1 UDP-2,4-diacetamido-2,4,6-trideoxy-beta-L-altropyranose hydrolase [Stutzerimonas stu
MAVQGDAGAGEAVMIKAAFRADASLQMGTGHVMRCLTLADALAAHGADCQFLCREHHGNLIEFIRNKGYIVHALPACAEPGTADLPTIRAASGEKATAHGHWLGTTQAEDVEACAPILAELQPDWLIVDHYALDAHWELALRPCCHKLMVIDDLADRPHYCDLLLDQTFGRTVKDYRAWLPNDCQVLCGSQYALLRPEFAALRSYSLQRRAEPRVRQLLISMGGVDKDNATGKVLEALRISSLPTGCQITVVMGAGAPWLSEVTSQAQSMPWKTRVLVGVSDMARLMADSDLAVGAAGATSWERCCMGLPTIMLVLADNQRQVAQGLEKAGAALVVQQAQHIAEFLPSLLSALVARPASLLAMSLSASSIIDGQGVAIISQLMES